MSKIIFDSLVADPKVPCRTEEARHAGEPSYAADIDHAEAPIESRLADNDVIMIGLVICCVVVGLVHVVLFIIGYVYKINTLYDAFPISKFTDFFLILFVMVITQL